MPVNKPGKIKLPWTWGLKIFDQYIVDALWSERELFTGWLLDVGCGKKPYRNMLGEWVAHWIGIDYSQTAAGPSVADAYASAYALPFPEKCFDVVLSTQVLEHLAEPGQMLSEAFRVLKVGGYLVITVPQTQWLHEEPHDYYRYTKYGLAYLAGSRGFRVQRIKNFGGVFALLGQTISGHLPLPLPRSWPGSLKLHHGLQAMAQLIFMGLERLRCEAGDTLGYIMVARKG